MVHNDYYSTNQLICPTVGGTPAADEWELVGIDPARSPSDAGFDFIHYGYQDVSAGNPQDTSGRNNYLAGAATAGNAPIFADRGALNSDGFLTSYASGNHPATPGLQNVLGGAHGVTQETTETVDDTGRPASGTYDETDRCMVGYSDNTLYDNIYADDDQGTDVSDTYIIYRYP
jgi:hypothetical protein